MPNSNKNLPEPQRQSITEATREAESRPLDYDPAERASYVRRMVQDIALWMSQGDSEEVIRGRVPDFIEKYPELFKKIINRNDLSPIQTMLTMLDKMASSNVTQHEASINVGTHLKNKFISSDNTKS